MNDFSKTGIGLIGIAVFAIVWVGQYFGIAIAEVDAVSFVQQIVGAVGIFMTYYGQYSRKDLVGGLIRK